MMKGQLPLERATNSEGKEECCRRKVRQCTIQGHGTGAGAWAMAAQDRLRRPVVSSGQKSITPDQAQQVLECQAEGPAGRGHFNCPLQPCDLYKMCRGGYRQTVKSHQGSQNFGSKPPA